MDCIELKMIEKWENCVQKILSMGNERTLNIVERIPSAGKESHCITFSFFI